MKTKAKARVSSIGMEAGRKQGFVQKGIDREEVKKAIVTLKCSKATGIDGINAEILKYGDAEWMLLLCDTA